MSYKRKSEDKKRYKKLYYKTNNGYPPAVYFKYWVKKPHLVRFWKSQGKNSCYAFCKKYARKKARNYANRNGFYEKKIVDPMYMAW